MDVKQRGILRDNHTTIIADLEPRDVLPQLYQDGILTENDLELISEGQTRRQRCQRLLAMLPTRGPQAYGSFTHALSEDGYTHISQLLEEALSQSKNGQGAETKCASTKNDEKTEKLKLPQIKTMPPENRDENNRKKKRVKRKKIADTSSYSSDEEYEVVNHRPVTTTSQCSKCSGYLPSEIEDPELRKFLQEHCCLLMENIEPRDITDYPYQERLLTDDECERIHKGVTRKDRCSHLLHALATNRPDQNSVQILMKSLGKKYSYIVEKCTAKSALFEDAGETTRSVETIGNSNVVTVEIIPYKEVTATYKGIEESDGSSLLIPKLNQTSTKGKSVEKNDLRKDNFIKNQNFKSAPKTLVTIHHGNVEGKIRAEHKLETKEVKNKLEKKEDTEINEVGNDTVTDESSVMVYKSPAGCSEPNKLPNRRLAVTFNHMSSLINQGEYDRFENLSFHLGRKYHTDADMKCLLAYLQASRHLYGNNFDAAEQHIDSAMEIVPMTTNPKYFTVELYTAKTRMYITQKKLKKLEDALDDVKQVIESDPVGCSGRAAGWLYMNDGRNKTSQMGMLNFNKPSAISAYQKLFQQAKESFIRALSNFEKDGGKDGPFGAGYAVCRLAILLLRCGDNGLTMDRMVPSSDDIRLAGGYLQRLEDSDIPINKILSLHYLLAKSDYQYRKSNTTRALEYADSALQVAQEMNLQEFIEHAHNRVLNLSMLHKGSGLKLEEVNDELEFKRIILSDSTEE